MLLNIHFFGTYKLSLPRTSTVYDLLFLKQKKRVLYISLEYVPLTCDLVSHFICPLFTIITYSSKTAEDNNYWLSRNASVNSISKIVFILKALSDFSEQEFLTLRPRQNDGTDRES